MSLQLENTSTNMAGMPELLELVRQQSQQNAPSGCHRGEKAVDTDVDGGEGASDACRSVGVGTGAEPAPDDTGVDGGEGMSDA